MVFLAQETGLKLSLGCESPSTCLCALHAMTTTCRARVLQFGGFGKQVGKKWETQELFLELGCSGLDLDYSNSLALSFAFVFTLRRVSINFLGHRSYSGKNNLTIPSFKCGLSQCNTLIIISFVAKTKTNVSYFPKYISRKYLFIDLNSDSNYTSALLQGRLPWFFLQMPWVT